MFFADIFQYNQYSNCHISIQIEEPSYFYISIATHIFLYKYSNRDKTDTVTRYRVGNGYKYKL